MQKRKSPIKHKVSSYTRDGKKVPSYVRGHGTKTILHLSNPNLLQKPKGYTITLKYSNKVGDHEKVEVIATSYERAVTEAFRDKTDKRLPIEIHVVDPSFGEVARWAGKHAVEFGKAVAKESYHTGKNLYNDTTSIALEHTSQGTGLSSSLAKRALERRNQQFETRRKQLTDTEVKRLINEAYSRNKTVRTLARAKLRTEHPEVYHVLDISTTKTPQ